MGTLATVHGDQIKQVTSVVDVTVKTCDSVLLAHAQPITFVKIDVEGFETRVLRGMSRTLDRWRPMITTEVLAEWLERAGSSVDELFELMSSLGYQPFGMRTVPHRMSRRLALERIEDPAMPARRGMDSQRKSRPRAIENRFSRRTVGPSRPFVTSAGERGPAVTAERSAAPHPRGCRRSNSEGYSHPARSEGTGRFRRSQGRSTPVDLDT